MPPKKCTHKARKAELAFLERPWAGPIHCYENPLHSAENPRRVPTKPVDPNTSAAWVGINCLSSHMGVFKFLLYVLTENYLFWIWKLSSPDLNSLCQSKA